MENTSHSEHQKSIEEDMAKAYAALKELPTKSSYRPEGCFTRKEFGEKYCGGSRTKTDAAIKALLEAKKIKADDHIGTGGLRFYYYVD